ncbi:plasmodesmata-located protein 2-like isoform X2 [Tripterygium wilfordii]|nr:plasmodesmata-located protein 2-like isoform X2 [Tripterygium wilfordii]
MDSILKQLPLQSEILLLLLCYALFVPLVKPNSDLNTVVYRNCSTHTLTSKSTNIEPSQTLSSLFQELISQSSHSKFYKTTSTGISGLFQCRGDLTPGDCHRCVNTLPDIMSNILCVSARVQLNGCYFLYAPDDATHNDQDHNALLYKSCSKEKEATDEFLEAKDSAFAEMVSGVVDSGNGFFTARHDSLELMAQCEGDFGPSDCGKCVSIAVQIAQEECRTSLSGQVYLDRCYVSYDYFPNADGDSHKEKQSGNNETGKKLAIVLGGVAALSFGLIFLSFLRRKEEDG